MKAIISIAMDNAAFCDNGHAEELGRILADLARKLESGALDPDPKFLDHYKLRDSNGNAVGDFRVILEEGSAA